MTNEITNTDEMAEAEYDGSREPSDARTRMSATKEAEHKGIEFHVSMHDYTFNDMQALIVEAAARVLVGEYGNNHLAKLIEARCMAIATEKVDQRLDSVTSEIIDQPLTPKYPFMKSDEKPMTMREFIGLTGRDYLTASVDSDGKPTTDRHYGKTRIQYLVEGVMGRSFANEIQKATNLVVAEIQNAIRAQHETFLNAEKARLREALAKAMKS